MTSDLLFAIAAWIFVIFMLGVGGGFLFAGLLATAIYSFRRGAWYVGLPLLVVWIFFALVFTASIMRIGERGGSYTDVWAWLRA